MTEERQFTQEELIDIIGKTESWRQYDDTKRTLEENGLVKKLSGEMTLNRQAVIDIAKAKGIDILPQYVDEVIRRFYPSEELQLEMLKKHGARLSGKMIPRLYSQEIIRELLRFKQPDESYSAKIYGSSDSFGLYITKFCKSKKPRKKDIAYLQFILYPDYFDLRLNVHEQSFFDKCGDVILNLNEQMAKSGTRVKEYNVIHDNIDIIKVY
jgi:hypothetical protein